MNKEALLGQYAYFKMVHGVTVRLIGCFSEAELDYRPKADMRSARELILHIYGMLRTFPVGVAKGVLTQEVENAAIPETEQGKAAMQRLKTVADCEAYARESFQIVEDGLAALSDAQLAAQVESPFGTFAGWQFFSFAYDEHWHHRGQLYTYLRLIGKEPPMLYDYENSPV